MASDLSKQEYLKRYLEENDKDKKRKKRIKTAKAAILPRIKIVNQDIDIRSIKFGSDKDITREDEDPTVAEVIDDRPLDVKSKEMYESSMWKKIGDNDSEIISNERDDHEKSPQSSEVRRKNINKDRHDSDSDLSPDRTSLVSKKSASTNKHHKSNLKQSQDSNRNAFPVRHDSDSDASPPRKKANEKETAKRRDKSFSARHDSDSDVLSPQIKTKEKETAKSQAGGSFPARHDSDSDMSPPRKKANERETAKSHSSSGTRKNSSFKSMPKNSDSDLSPVRPNRKQSSHSSKNNYNSDSDLSPAREPRRRSSPFKSYNHNSDSDLSPPRKSNMSSDRRGPQSKDENYRPTQTLSGMKAGLQNAATLRKETKEFRKRETDQIRQLDDELSGRNATTIIRDRRTGKKRDIEEETRVDEEKEKKLSETQQKYAQWGKGIEQSENQKQKLTEDMYEMSKPLARYYDDEDLDAKLKADIRDDDPMAEYMRKKRRKGDSSVFPVYSGPQPPPNRFGIPPGYRWDGVDRSNGFEKKYFDQKASKKASEEEAYLWSVQDM